MRPNDRISAQQNYRERKNRSTLLLCCSIIALCLLAFEISFALTDDEIFRFQSGIKDKPIGEKIAFWAEKFIGAPYDDNPLGEYVSRSAIVADDRVDCMYLTFRTVELALSDSPEEAVSTALDKRFHSMGILDRGRITNYESRFEYGEDMIKSGKWGREITSEIGKNIKIQAPRVKGNMSAIPSAELLRQIARLKNGDILFFIKYPEKRIKGEVVGHIGIVKTESQKGKSEVYLIHAAGTKGKGGAVKKILLTEYLKNSPFIGAALTRFD